jgi:DNA polymerase-3 subunit delta'
MAAEFFEQLLAVLNGYVPQADTTLQRKVEAAATSWRGNAEAVADCLERCLEVHAQIEANANLATLIESWLDDLGQMKLAAV